MAVRPIDGNALHTIISAWPESIMYKDWVQSAIATAPTLPQPSNEPLTGWVSMDERLPEKRKDVLVRYGNGRIGIDWIDSIQCFVFDELYGRVTHWMPIPELPDRRPPEGKTDA